MVFAENFCYSFTTNMHYTQIAFAEQIVPESIRQVETNNIIEMMRFIFVPM